MQELEQAIMIMVVTSLLLGSSCWCLLFVLDPDSMIKFVCCVIVPWYVVAAPRVPCTYRQYMIIVTTITK